jgi:hypothetical protein
MTVPLIMTFNMLGSEIELPDILVRLFFMTVGDLMLYYGLRKAPFTLP